MRDPHHTSAMRPSINAGASAATDYADPQPPSLVLPTGDEAATSASSGLLDGEGDATPFANSDDDAKTTDPPSKPTGLQAFEIVHSIIAKTVSPLWGKSPTPSVEVVEDAESLLDDDFRSFRSSPPHLAMMKEEGEVVEEARIGSMRAILMAACNFTNAIVGAGVIAMPFAFRRAGLLAGMLLLAVVGYFTYYSVNSIVLMGSELGQYTYEGSAEALLGRRGRNMVIVFRGLLAFGAMNAYLLIIADSLSPLASPNVSREGLLLLVSTVFVLPVSLLRDVSKLSFTSFVAVAADVLLLLLIAIQAPREVKYNMTIKPVSEFSIIRPGVFGAIGTLSFAFTCQHSIFLVLTAMPVVPWEKQGSAGGPSLHHSQRSAILASWDKVNFFSVLTAFLLSLAFALVGYLNFFEYCKPNILNNFASWRSGEVMFATQKSGAMTIDVARVMLAMTMMLTYPLELFVLRHAVATALLEGDPQGAYHYRITLGIWLMTLLVAVGMKDLGAILEVTGVVAASYLSYIIPARMHFTRCPWRESLAQFHSSREVESPNYTPRCLDRVRFLWSAILLDGLMLWFGYVSLIFGVVTALVRIFWGD